jgi:hypothetical protein
MFNPAIVIAILIQSYVARASRIAGAIVGYIVTTGILIWGLAVYAEGNYITLFGAELSQPVFLLACLIWYAFDTREFLGAQKESDEIEKTMHDPILQDDRVKRFYQTTLSSWAGGQLSALGPLFKQEGKMKYEEFVKSYRPTEGSALAVFFNQFPPREEEFLVGVGNSDAVTERGWFVLTNQRLIQKDGRDNSFKEISLDDVDSYQVNGGGKPMVFTMKSGKVLDFDKVVLHPAKNILGATLAKGASLASQAVPHVPPSPTLPKKTKLIRLLIIAGVIVALFIFGLILKK